MRSVLTVCIICIVMGLAYWAYQENIKTQAAIAQSERLQSNIGQAHARLTALRAEWAYLNRPDRLINLAVLNFTDLQLSPLRAENLGDIDQIQFRDENNSIFDDLEVVEVAGRDILQ